MPDPVIDVLLPIYNAADTIEETIRSLQAQTEPNYRVLAVDDGSTDGTAEVLARLAREDRRIEVVSKPNGGIVDALNHGLALTRAPVVARHDADDLSYPERFRDQLDYLQAHADCVAVSGFARHVDAASRPLGTYAILPDPESCDAHAVPSREPYLMHPFVAIRREALQRIGGYRYAFHSEDTDLYWRLSELGRLHNLPYLLGDYRLHAASISSASVLNGRIAAIASQLAGLSHLRRLAGRPDIAFPRERLQAYKDAASAEGIVRAAAADLDTDETAYLRIAFAAKLMELSSYRPYRLEPEDYAFIRREIARAMPSLDDQNRKNVTWLVSRSQAKLLRRLRLPQFVAFTPLKDYPVAAARAILKKPRALNPRPPDPPQRPGAVSADG